MVHMLSVPAGAAVSPYQNQLRMVYITNTELDDSEPGTCCCTIRTSCTRTSPAPGINRCAFTSAESGGLQLEGRTPGVISSNPGNYLIKSESYREFIFRGFEMLERSIQERPPHTSPYISAMAHSFLQSLLAIVSDLLDGRAAADNGRVSDELSLAEAIRRYVDRNYTRNFSLSELADSLHINRYYASHTFSAAFGMTIVRYRTLRRIGEAQSLLTDTDNSVTYIASLVGYDDPNQFTQAFAKIVGMPPSKYRELSVWPFRLNKKERGGPDTKK